MHIRKPREYIISKVFDFLSDEMNAAIERVPIEKLYEIRVRADKPVIVNYGGSAGYLTDSGISIDGRRAFRVTADRVREMVFELCERSIYSYTDKICRGFITLRGGIRVGLCGECVIDNGQIINIKNITSLNIRIPHAVKGCSDKVFARYRGGIKNTLVISPPGSGKTTLVRDLAEKISEKLMLNVLVVDERNEIFPLMSSADTVDCIVYSPKIYAFENGVRSMSPDVIVTDELIGEDDARAVYRACRSGIKVIATAHGSSADCLKERGELSMLSDIFELTVVLDESNGKGTIKEIIEV